ncbi:MAG: hypothetical protein NC043_03130 [Muribaculaceae bacterium]|nr:hypothetical protein [Muribaculaceae bacterium]
MKTEFDFNKIGKREPYSVPDGYFDMLDHKIMTAAVAAKSRIPVWRWVLTCVSSVAAVAVIMVTFMAMPQKNISCTMDDVELTFTKLHADDREYFLETYEDDIFLTQITEE